MGQSPTESPKRIERFCNGVRTIEGLCPTKRCAFLFGEVLHCVHFSHKKIIIPYIIVIKNRLGGGSTNTMAQ